jgi:lipid II flippase MurJ-like protein
LTRSAVFVAAGILCSRLAGLVRLRVFAHYFGLQSDAADAFNAAFRIPNFLQNLFGEGALSASFIPVYAALVARGEQREADRVAGAVAALLALVVAALVLAGVLATPLLIAAIAPGFTGEKRDLTIQIVRILFPGAGLLVLSAWCLGVLNSHHKFLLSYTAPVMWNAAMIATLVAFGAGTTLPRLAVLLAWGSVAGSALQFAVQLPPVLRVAPDVVSGVSGAFHRGGAVRDHVRTVTRNFVPVFISRGVVQVSAYIDALLASLLPTGAVTGLSNAQLLYTLPVSLFGMSIAAAELPAMSAVGVEGQAALRARLDAGLRQIAFFVVPSAMAFLALGDVVAAALLQTGRRRLRVGHSGGVRGRPARVDARPLVLINLLRAARHADTAAIRDAARRADDDPRLSLRDSAAALARPGAAVGRRRADGLSRHRRLGGDAPAEGDVERPHRPDGTAGCIRHSALDGSGDGRRGGVGGEAHDSHSSPGGDGRSRARPVWDRLLRDDLRAARSRGDGLIGARRAHQAVIDDTFRQEGRVARLPQTAFARADGAGAVARVAPSLREIRSVDTPGRVLRQRGR